MLWEEPIFLAPLALVTTKYGTTAGDVRTAHRDQLLALIEEIAAVAMTTGAVVDADTAVQFFDSVPATIQSSMQHDAAAGQAIEIEAIGGAILRAGVLSGVATPVTERFVEELRSHPTALPADDVVRQDSGQRRLPILPNRVAPMMGVRTRGWRRRSNAGLATPQDSGH